MLPDGASLLPDFTDVRGYLFMLGVLVARNRERISVRY